MILFIAGLITAARALRDGTVAAVGYQTDFAGHTFGIILQNAASAPKRASTVAVPSATRVAPLDAAAVERFLAAIGPVDPPLSFTGHRARAHQAADNGAREVLSVDI
jgi:hypothetical protein